MVTVNSSSKLGKGCGILFFSVFALFGVGFMWLMSGSLMKDWRTRSWVAAEAVLLGMPLEHWTSPGGDSGKKGDRVPFRYSYGGQSYTADTVNLTGDFSVNEKRSDNGPRLMRMPAGTKVTCYVNPANPAEAVLEHRSLTYAWFLLLPGVFLLVGLGGVFGLLFVKPAAAKPASARHRSGGKDVGTIIVWVMGIIFTGAGAALVWFLTLGPVLKSRTAESEWRRVPCKIDSASVKSSRGSKGGYTYRIAVDYRYSVDGVNHSGSRYDFSTGSSSGRKWRDAAVERLLKEPNPHCYVNPTDPADSVLSTQLGSDVWFGLFGLIFLAVGIGLPFAVSRGNAGARLRSDGAPTLRPVATAGGEVELKPATTGCGCIGVGIIALVWNGIVVGLWVGVDDCPTALLVIFGIIGAAIIAGWLHTFLATFNPKPLVTASSATVPLGGSIRLRWRLDGSVRRIGTFSLRLCACEKATYQRGTRTTTDTNWFVDDVIFETREHSAMASGEVVVPIPADSMHSFDAPRNKIEWSLRLHGDIAKWPDVKVEFPIVVLPPPRG